MPISNITCITPEPEDNNDSFGYPVAINNKYLAIGDFLANRIIIYTRDKSGQWSRTKIVLPPKDSSSDQVGYGFSEQFQLDENCLVISTSDDRYLINLDTEIKVKPISLPIERNAGLVTFNLFAEGKIRKVTLPDRGEANFGVSFAHHKNWLLVGSPSYTEERGAWLYDLDQLDQEPEKLAIPNVYMGETVALNEEFAVVGNPNSYRGSYRTFSNNISNRPKLTLIKAIKSGFTTIEQKVGKLSLSGNILAFMNPSSTHFVEGGILELYRLYKHRCSHFILRRGYVSNALVQNGFLITAFDNYELARHEIHIQEIV